MDTLVRVLCHDLRNPITGGRELLNAATEMNPEYAEDDSLDFVGQALDSALEMINNVSVLAQLEDCKLRINLGSYSLFEMCSSAVTILHNLIESKNINLVQDVAVDCYLDVDNTAFINSVLVNALTNAIKFSDSGSTIEVVDFKDEDQVGFIVRDFGMGMPKAIIEQLMSDRNIPSTKGTLGEAGMGYGLKLMKKFTEMFDGKISITSSDTQPDTGFVGTNIKFSFPA